SMGVIYYSQRLLSYNLHSARNTGSFCEGFFANFQRNSVSPSYRNGRQRIIHIKLSNKVEVNFDAADKKRNPVSKHHLFSFHFCCSLHPKSYHFFCRNCYKIFCVFVVGVNNMDIGGGGKKF